MTASSVTSLSLDPPMMLACLNTRVPTPQAVSRLRRYVVNMLGEGQGDLAQQFAAAQPPTSSATSRCPRAGSACRCSASALAHIECEVVEAVVGGTHTHLPRPRGARRPPATAQPLTYFRGGFGRFEFARDDEVYQRARRPGAEPGRTPPTTCCTLDELADQLGVDAACRVLRPDPAGRRRPGAPRPRPRLRHHRLRRAHLGRDVRRPAARSSSGVIAAWSGRRAADDERRRAAPPLRDDGQRCWSASGSSTSTRYLDANYAFHEHLVSLARNPAAHRDLRHASASRA